REAHIPALILGSGPSLDDALPFIKDFQGVIFASPSQLDILEYWEIIPKYVVAVDTSDSVADEQIRTDHDFFGMTLLAHPYLCPRVFDLWTGNRRYYHLSTNNDQQTFRDIYPWITLDFGVAGSTPNIAVMMANYFGCNPIILAGV